MKKLSLIILIACSQLISAQNDTDASFWDQVRFGGGLGLGFGSNYTTISISPSAIYEFDPAFALGITTSYLYSKSNDLKSNVYGVGMISLFNPIQEIQLSAEFEQLFVSQKFFQEKSNFNYPALYLGAAFRTGNFSFGLRYDVLYDASKNIYGSAYSPVLRFYF